MVCILSLLLLKSFLSSSLMGLLISFPLLDQLVESVSVGGLQLVLSSQVGCLLLCMLISQLLERCIMLN
jgi:hypothetical protein